MIVDTHCHFDMYPNPMDVINQAEKEGIVTIGMTNLPSHFKMGHPHIKGYKKIRLALGMHPLLAEMHSSEFSLFYKYLPITSYIGEIGLDFSREGLKTKKIQLDSFIKILKAVEGKPKILSIHSRRAERDVLNLLISYNIKNAIFHWYSGSLNLIDQIAESGYFFSINPAMLKSESGRKIVKKIPREYILTESDGPYIETNGRAILPRDIKTVIEYLGSEYQITNEAAEGLIKANFNRLLRGLKIPFDKRMSILNL